MFGSPEIPWTSSTRRYRKELLDAKQIRGIIPEKVAARIRTGLESDRPRALYAIGNNTPAVHRPSDTPPHNHGV
ncbi:hypothetical protein ACL02S_24255, partial [Nocardia sp. 004]